MKPFTILFLSIVAAAGTAFLLFALMAPKPSHAETTSAIDARANETLASTVDGLAKNQQALAQQIEELRRELALDNSSARVPTGDIEAAIARALAKVNTELTPKNAEAPLQKAAKFDVKTAFAQLSDPSADFGDFVKVFGTITDDAEMSELVKLFEERAKNSPNDAKAQVQLGQAYLQKLFKTSNPMEQGSLATLADKSFDRALAIDDHDWSARFNKATSLSHWPAQAGKQHETINHLEVLVQQQEASAMQPYHAQSHILLGNMYSQIGEKAKAMAAWQKGLALFPDDATLKKQIAAAQAH
ncbi:MAG: hypothetical protein SGI72_16705 [Planctomycetota bacterium]|nr:hypothetical protein [Planctomycetota bacterium]